VVANLASGAKTAQTPMEQGPYFQSFTMEPATRIERATCGLRNSKTPTSGNLNPQETTKEDTSEVGTDGSELSCPGSSVRKDEIRDGGLIPGALGST